jgi:hypothetical protein
MDIAADLGYSREMRQLEDSKAYPHTANGLQAKMLGFDAEKCRETLTLP